MLILLIQILHLKFYCQCLNSKQERFLQQFFLLLAQHPNFREGRPKKYTKEQLDLAVNLLEKHSYSQVVKITGISKSTIARHKRVLHES